VFRFVIDDVVPAPPDEVFAEVLDATRYPEWAPGVIEAGHRTAGPPAPSAIRATRCGASTARASSPRSS
jgi:hypothetical protein